MLSKNINVNGKWKRVELTEDETRDVLDKLLETNLNEMQKCEEKANDYNKNMSTNLSHAQIVRMLFDKQATASFTAISSAIDEKAFRPEKSEIQEENEEPEEEQEVEEPPKPHEPTTLDKAFKKT